MSAVETAAEYYRRVVEHVPCTFCDEPRPVTVEYERDLPCTGCNLTLLALYFRTVYRRGRADLPAAVGAYYGVAE